MFIVTNLQWVWYSDILHTSNISDLLENIAGSHFLTANSALDIYRMPQ